MSVVGTASMLRARRRDVNVKPNRRLDRKSSRGMLYENEELRLRTININAEVERGQNDIKKLRRENELLRREIWGLREEYDRLESLLGILHGRAISSGGSQDSFKKHFDVDGFENGTKNEPNGKNQKNLIEGELQSCESSPRVELGNSNIMDACSSLNRIACDENNSGALHITRLKNNFKSIFPEEGALEGSMKIYSDVSGNQFSSSYQIPSRIDVHQKKVWSQPLFSIDESNLYCAAQAETSSSRKSISSNTFFSNNRRDVLKKAQSEFSLQMIHDQHVGNILPISNNHCESFRDQELQSSCKNRKNTQNPTCFKILPFSLSGQNLNSSKGEICHSFARKSHFPEGGNLEELLSDMQRKSGHLITPGSSRQRLQNSGSGLWFSKPNENSVCMRHNYDQSIIQKKEGKNKSANHKAEETESGYNGEINVLCDGMATTSLDNAAFCISVEDNLFENVCGLRTKKWLSKSEQVLNHEERNILVYKSASFPPSSDRMKMNFNSFGIDEPQPTKTSIMKAVNGCLEDQESAAVSRKWHRRRSMPRMHDDDSLFTAYKSKLEIIGDSSVFLFQHHTMNEETMLKQEIASVSTGYKRQHASPLADTNEISDGEFTPNSMFQKGIARKHAFSFPTNLDTKYTVKNKNAKYVSTDGLYHCIQSYSKTNHNSSGSESHFQSLHKMSVIVGDTERGRSFLLDHSLSSCWKDPYLNEHYAKHMTVCSNNQRNIGISAREETHLINENKNHTSEKHDTIGPNISSTLPLYHDVALKGIPSGRSIPWERTDSIDSLSSSVDINVNSDRTKRVRNAYSDEQKTKESLPWCGCWGNGCI